MNSISLNASTNNYLYFNDNLNFTRNGHGNEMTIDSNGKVGINTVSPGRQMHIFSGSSGHPVILERGDTSNTQIEMKTGGATRGFMGCSTTANFIVYDNDASDIQFQVLQNGHLLAGTTSGSVSGGRALILSKSDGARIKLCRDASGVGNGDGFELVMAADDRAYIWNRESADMLFGTGGTERVKITSSGVLQISPSGTVKMSFYNDASGGLNHITSNSGQEFKVSSGNGDSNGIEFWDYTGTNKRCQIDGHGIKFNADTAAANALDDYEEGSWTPTVQSGGSGITVYSANYTKIGRLVQIQMRGLITGTNNSGLIIAGLPYANAGPNNGHQVGPVMHNGWDYGGSTEPVAVSYITGTNSYFQFYYSQTNSNGWHNVTGSETGGDQFITSLSYMAAS